MRPTISSRPGGRAHNETRGFSHVRVNTGAENYKQITVQLGTWWLSSGEEYIHFFQLTKKNPIRPPLQWCHTMMDYTLDRHVPSKHTCGSPLLRDTCKKDLEKFSWNIKPPVRKRVMECHKMLPTCKRRCFNLKIHKTLKVPEGNIIQHTVISLRRAVTTIQCVSQIISMSFCNKWGESVEVLEFRSCTTYPDSTHINEHKYRKHILWEILRFF